MKKLLTLILIILLLVISALIAWQGIQLGNFRILSIQELIEENDNLDEKISKAKTLTESTYKSELSKLNSNVSDLESTKKEYEQLVAITSESNYQLASREENYKLEYLYFQLGTIANRNNVTLTIDIATSSSGTSGLYDIILTTDYAGKEKDESGYVKITDFIYDVENDPTLGFKVEEFELAPSSNGGYALKGKFKAKNISIQDMSQISSQNNSDNTQTSEGSEDDKTNTTDSTQNSTNKDTTSKQ